MSLESKLKILKDRSLMLKKVRYFFYNKKITEVDPPSLIKHPSLDDHIESIQTHPINDSIGYLHTSPEYIMKRMIASGLKNIYFLGHVFRKDEIGQNHNLEFTMIEWYKSNISYEKFVDENIKLIKLFVKIKKVIKISYFDLFLKNYNLNIFKCSKEDLLNKAKQLNKNFSDEKSLSKDDLLNLLMNYFFENPQVFFKQVNPDLPNPDFSNKNFQKQSFSKQNFVNEDFLYVVYDFPSSMAALAKIEKKNNQLVAKRFEFFFNGLEIANGYFELNDENLLRQRFNKIIKNKKNLSIDENFLKSINKLGSCFGIAIGFDRLMMLKHKSKNIEDVLPLSFLEI